MNPDSQSAFRACLQGACLLNLEGQKGILLAKTDVPAAILKIKEVLALQANIIAAMTPLKPLGEMFDEMLQNVVEQREDLEVFRDILVAREKEWRLHTMQEQTSAYRAFAVRSFSIRVDLSLAVQMCKADEAGGLVRIEALRLEALALADELKAAELTEPGAGKLYMEAIMNLDKIKEITGLATLYHHKRYQLAVKRARENAEFTLMLRGMLGPFTPETWRPHFGECQNKRDRLLAALRRMVIIPEYKVLTKPMPRPIRPGVGEVQQQALHDANELNRICPEFQVEYCFMVFQGPQQPGERIRQFVVLHP